MKVVIAGGSGLIGRALSSHLASAGHRVVILTRDSSRQSPSPTVRHVQWDPDGSAGAWAIELDGADAVVNLTGASIADRRWTASRRAELRSSRILPTRNLVAAIRRVSTRPTVFVQGSAVGFYGVAEGDRELDESFPPGDDFLADLCVAWEAEAHPVAALGCRLVILRIGIVLSADGGVVARLRLPFRLFVGGPVSTGRQYVSWIHHADLTTMIAWAVTTASVTGAVNASATLPVTNARFSAALGRALHRPSWFPVPAFGLKLVFGELADALLVNGQRVLPKRALELGFAFAHPTIEEAMDSCIR